MVSVFLGSFNATAHELVRMRNHDGIDAEIEERKGLLHAVMFSCYKPFGWSLAGFMVILLIHFSTAELLLFDRMAFLLDLWSSLVLGILYLAFQAYPIIFGEKHGFNLQMTGMSFLGIGIGMVIGTVSMPWWNK